MEPVHPSLGREVRPSGGSGQGLGPRLDFDRVASTALARADAVVSALLPDGRREGSEWVALNPRRQDKRRGSFKVNLRTGRWGDFSSGDRGRDLVSLSAFIANLDQRQAAIRLAASMGIDPYE